MKRVLFIVPLPPPVHGSSMISQYIKDSKQINESYRCDYVNLSTSRKMEEIGNKTFVKIWRFLSSLLRTMGLLLTHKYDRCFISITCHGKGFLKDMPFVLLCKMFGGKIILHQENKGMSRDVDRWPYNWLMPIVYRNAKVVLLSWLLYPDIEKVVKREQVVICPNCAAGIDSCLNRIGNQSPRILYLGNMIVGKGVLFLLDALKILHDNGCDFVSDYVGGETAEINSNRFSEEVHKRNLDGIVTYHGSKVGKEKDRLLYEADIFVFPTFYHNESFPLVLLEAMQHKLPIVTTNEGGISDIVNDGDNGFICEKNNPESLANCIKRLLDDKQLRIKMGENGYNKYRQEYTIQTFEKRIIQLLDNSNSQ